MPKKNDKDMVKSPKINHTEESASEPISPEVLPKQSPKLSAQEQLELIEQLKKIYAAGGAGMQGAKAPQSAVPAQATPATNRAWVKKLPKNLAHLMEGIFVAKDFMFASNIEDANYNPKVEGELRKHIWKPIKFGLLVILGFILAFFVWGGLAPLDSAAIAPGYIVLSGNHKTIQHPDGGIVRQIMVKDGDFVQENQDLLIMDDNNARAQLQIALSGLRTHKGIEIRLLAERDGEEELKFEGEIFDSNDLEVQKIIKVQNDMFQDRSQTLASHLDILNQRISSLNEQIAGRSAQYESTRKQLALIKQQLSNAQKLHQEGFLNRTELIRVQTHYEQLNGQLGELRGGIAAMQEQIGETKLQIISAQNEFKGKVNEELKQVQGAVAELTERYNNSKEVFKRTVIRAPSSGIVTALQVHTISGVIGPGAKIMDIVPQDDKLIVEAHIRHNDIEGVKAGIPVKVQLDAYRTRLVPRVDGKVIYVSPDRVMDERAMSPQGNQPYYVVKVEIDESSISKVNSEINLYPGMPAEVFLVKGTRTFLQYMLTPIIDSFHRSFKEA
jgi:HlyD family type I secretion membrane fusion protein